MGLCTFYHDDEDVDEMGDVDSGLKLIEVAQKRLQEAKEFIKGSDFGTNNCQTLGSHILEEDIPRLLNEALKYIGHSVTYKQNYNIKEIGKSKSEDINSLIQNLNDITPTFNRNVTIDIPSIVAKYLESGDEEDLNILKGILKIDFMHGMDPESECYWYVHGHINDALSTIESIVECLEYSKKGYARLTKEFDEDIIGWFKEVFIAGRLLTFDSFDADTSRAVWAYNYYFSHPEIHKILSSKYHVSRMLEKLAHDPEYYSEYSNLYEYREKLIKEFEEMKEREANLARFEAEFLANYRR